MAEAIRPVWRDRIYGEEGQPTFDLNDPRLPQLTPVIQEGTFHNSGRMNNLFVFDNWIAMSDTEYKIEGLTISTKKIVRTITEKEADPETGEKRLIARQTMELIAEAWVTTEELYDINEFGQNVIVQKRISSQKKEASGEWSGDVV